MLTVLSQKLVEKSSNSELSSCDVAELISYSLKTLMAVTAVQLSCCSLISSIYYKLLFKVYFVLVMESPV